MRTNRPRAAAVRASRLLLTTSTWLLLFPPTLHAAQPMGPLKVHPQNPRYFVTPQGRALFLTGSHTWANFQERGLERLTPNFDYEGYLDFLQQHGHNFIRLWTWEHAQWMQFVPDDVPVRYKPLPYQRTGPGLALDGKPKFDLTRFNPEYFRRLRRRVEQARQRGLYVSVMLFQGFSLDNRRGRKHMGNAWHGHPFHPANNVNGMDGNPSGDDTGHEVHTLKVPEVTRLQEAYVRKVVDTLNDLDNVLWEIGNECRTDSVAWQYHMIRFLRRYESAKGAVHPVGMTGAPIREKALFASPADWVSPPGRRWLNDPPPNDGRKVVLVDNDHCDPWGHDPSWVWKNFCRGNGFLFMDPYTDYRIGWRPWPVEDAEPIRKAMGVARRLADQLPLEKMTPRPDVASSRYCLASDDGQFVVFTEGSTVELTVRPGTYRVRWIHPVTGQARQEPDRRVVSGQTHFQAPFRPGAVLHVRRR